MKLFGWKSTGRASARPAQLAAALARSPFTGTGQWPGHYDAQLREGYLKNPIALRAVRLIADGTASTRIIASDAEASWLITSTTHGQHLMETLATHLILHGNAYVQIIQGADGRPCELFALRPERMSVEADARGWPGAFRYKLGNATTRLALEDVIHIRSHHPLDDHYGLGCLDAASGPIAIHNASSRWNKALLDNAARPSGALLAEGVDALKADQFERLKEELERAFQGAANAGRPMLLEGGLKWQPLSLSPADMDFAGLKAAAAREIALAFGVPPVLLGLPGDATYANYREANKALWQQAIVPLAQRIIGAIAQGLSPWFPGLTLRVDLDRLPALAEDRERLWQQLQSADFLTRDEKREAAGFGAIGDEKEVPPKNGAERELGNITGSLEMKFNPWHDPGNGQFAREGSGNHYGAPIGRAVAGAVIKRVARKPVPPPPPKVQIRPISKPPVSKNPPFRGGGGSFGGAGASGDWGAEDIPEPKVAKPPARQDRSSKLDLPDVSLSATRPNVGGAKTYKQGGYHFEIDAKDRTVRAYGQLRLAPAQRRSRSAQAEAGMPNRLPMDHGGHYIGRQFGGPETRYNHFAQNARFNLSDYRKVENEWKAALKNGKTVKVDIRSYYHKNSKRPTRLKVFYKINGKLYIAPFFNEGKK